MIQSGSTQKIVRGTRFFPVDEIDDIAVFLSSRFLPARHTKNHREIGGPCHLSGTLLGK